MKPFLLESNDNEALRTLGRASVQVVHDLKNQLNGLKLYATFLRKRAEKSERPADELETIAKLLAGLDRLAADLSLIVEFGQPVQLTKRAGTDLQKIMREVATRLNDRGTASGSLPGSIVVAGEGGPLFGEFDPVLLARALESISIGAMKLRNKAPAGSLAGSLEIKLTPEVRVSDVPSHGVIEWPVPEALAHDPFHSFAGSDELRLAVAARIVEAHGGSAERTDGALRVSLPL